MITFGVTNRGKRRIKDYDLANVDKYVNKLIEHFNLDKYEADIDIEFVDRCDSDAGGYCFGDDEQIEIEIAKSVQGEKLDFESMMVSLAHEMVHAKQLITHQLVDQGIQMSQLRGCTSMFKVSIWEGHTFIDTAYEDMPWEKEAYALEKGLYDAYKSVFI